MSMKLTVAICQLKCLKNKWKNIEKVTGMIGRIMKDNSKVKLICLPEAVDVFDIEKEKLINEAIKWPFDLKERNMLTECMELAKKYQVQISIGSCHVHRKEEKKIRNTHILINDDGEIIDMYDKIHLFQICQKNGIEINENNWTINGTKLKSSKISNGFTFGYGICFDVRFPLMADRLRRERNVDILTYPSAFTRRTGEDHWNVLLRCRAIENQCYVIAATQYNQNLNSTYGHSMVIDPWGRILIDLKKEEDIYGICELDKTLIEELRNSLPITNVRNELNDFYDNKPSLINPINWDTKQIYFSSKILVPSNQIFCRTKLSFAFVNIRPLLPYHILISPLRNDVKRFTNLTSKENEDIFQLSQIICKKFEQNLHSDSFTIAIQDGEAAGQSVSHVHIHLIPRIFNDLENNDDIYKELNRDMERSLSEERNNRSLAEMENEAVYLRNIIYAPQ
ncbi:hypothetical protein SNEBB_009067 [Seison nebaliae]|nr:hypothetical protein SNEBB_009067 [Seison nebaliae]